MDKMEMHSPDLSQQNVEKLKELFPNCVTESRDKNGKPISAIDFDLLKQELSDHVVEGPQERYRIDWPGKREAILIGNAPIAKTLRPAREESVDFDNTKNLFIEGDNLAALKLLQETYLNKVKMIYIDPPYNTGKDFIFKDDYTEDLATYLERSNQVDDNGNRLEPNTETNGRFHSNWLSMMYPRLKLARNLLRDDGVIFISIGDYEQANLKRLCDEVFGGENFLSSITRVSKKGGNKGSFLKPKKDHIIVYFKSKEDMDVETFGIKNKMPNPEDWEIENFNGCERKYMEGDSPYREKLEIRKNQRYYIEATDGSLMIPKGDVFPSQKQDAAYVYPESENDKCWTWSRKRYLREKENHRFIFKKTQNSPYLDENGNQSKWSIYKKVFEDEFLNKKTILSDYLDKFPNSLGTKALSNLGIPFDYPKPVELIEFIVAVATANNDIILDFFAGSGTTAHAVMQLNAQYGSKRQCISVQLPQLTDKKKAAYKAGYKNIAELSKERIRRAGKKIKEENPETDIDIGFRVLKVDTSNMKDVYYLPDEVNQADLLTRVNNIKPDRTCEDLLFQVLLDWGVDLTLPIEKREISGKTVYFVDDDALVACFNTGIDETFINEVAKIKPLRVVFRDSGFASDAVKINVTQIFKLISPDTDIRTI